MIDARRETGFTLIELLIALVLGLLVIAGVSAVFLSGTRNYREDERIARMHDNTRFALAELTNEIEMAGHWTELFFPPVQIPGATAAPGSLAPMATNVPVAPTAGSDCGPGAAEWKYDTTPAIEIRDNVATGAAATGFFSCITATEFQPNTDIISIKRLAGTSTAAADLVTNAIYFRTNNSSGELFRADGTAVSPVIPAPARDWRYNVTIYYIRNYFTVAGDGIPSLCRELLQGIDIEGDSAGCIPGIENLQLEAGIDTNNDGVANFYKAAPTTVEFAQIVGVRVVMLSRTAERLNGYTNLKTYTLSNLPAYAPADPFPRELTTASVLVRNTSSLSLYGP